MDPLKLSAQFQCKICLGGKQCRFEGRIVRHDGSGLDCDHSRDCEFCQATGLDLLAVREAAKLAQSGLSDGDRCPYCYGFGDDTMFGDGTQGCLPCLATGINIMKLEELLLAAGAS